MSAEPLSREDFDWALNCLYYDVVSHAPRGIALHRARNYVNAEEAGRKAAEERADALRAAAIRAKAHLSDERSAAAHAAAAELLDALAADDAARGDL